MQVTREGSPSGPPCPRQLSDNLSRTRASSTHTALAFSQSRACLRGVGPGRYGQPGLHPSALWCRGLIPSGGVRLSRAQRSWTEGGPLAEAQGGRGGDGGKTGPEMQHSCDTTALAQREGSSHRLPDTQGCLPPLPAPGSAAAPTFQQRAVSPQGRAKVPQCSTHRGRAEGLCCKTGVQPAGLGEPAVLC